MLPWHSVATWGQLNPYLQDHAVIFYNTFIVRVKVENVRWNKQIPSNLRRRPAKTETFEEAL